nr:probable disease resistance protein At4g27220 [Ziziphus jujuba var. spinosa]
MHDIIRDVAISIARNSHMYCFTDDSEVRYLESDVLEKSKAILTPNGYVAELLREGLEYNELNLIWMWQNRASQIPDKFFEITKNLRVLRLGSDERLEKLSSSLCSLGNLRTLILRCCNVGDISLIRRLKKLEILDLSECGIKELPREVGKLPCLRMIDLRQCAQLTIIQPDVISNLKSLEELYVVDSFNDWDGQVPAVNGDQRNASLDELKLLKQLTTLHLEVADIKVLPKDLFRSMTLEQYQISVGCKLTGRLIDDSSKCLELSLDENNLLDDYGLERLLASTQTLSLYGLQELKHLQLINNRTFQLLVKSTEQIHPCSVFGSLETLQLENLAYLEKICDEELTKESFKRLRIIKVSYCNLLKNLLPSSMSKLEKIEIIDCGMMEEIVSAHEEEEDMSKEVIGDFPRLRSLKLKNVPRLKCFCFKLKQPMDVDNSVKTLLSGKIDNLERLTTFSSEIDIDFPVLTKLYMEYCPEFSTFISKFEDEKLPSLFNEKVAFPSLKKLKIRIMNNLKMLVN